MNIMKQHLKQVTEWISGLVVNRSSLMRHKDILNEIKQLNPVKDHQRIAYLTANYEFPWDTTRSLELALFRTFAVAKGTALLAGTGEFTQRPQKRYDDTVLLLAEILENGYDSERGRAALRRMNQLHGRFNIPNDEFLYVLSTFVFEPIRWNTRFGWRPLLKQEKLAAYYYWREVGLRMNIKSIPPDYESLERYNIEHEDTHFRFAESNYRLAKATRDMFLGWFLPRWLWPLGEPFIYAIMDDRLLSAVGFPQPAPWIRRFVEGCMKVRARLLRFMPGRRRPHLITQQKHLTYPDGYQIEQLGPQ
jgi:hypothetical protein